MPLFFFASLLDSEAVTPALLRFYLTDLMLSSSLILTLILPLPVPMPLIESVSISIAMTCLAPISYLSATSSVYVGRFTSSKSTTLYFYKVYAYLALKLSWFTVVMYY